MIFANPSRLRRVSQHLLNLYASLRHDLLRKPNRKAIRFSAPHRSLLLSRVRNRLVSSNSLRLLLSHHLCRPIRCWIWTRWNQCSLHRSTRLNRSRNLKLPGRRNRLPFRRLHLLHRQRSRKKPCWFCTLPHTQAANSMVRLSSRGFFRRASSLVR